MIKSIKQAEHIQERRVIGNKRGYAKAVRRYLLLTDSKNYQSILNSLKSLPILKKPAIVGH